MAGRVKSPWCTPQLGRKASSRRPAMPRPHPPPFKSSTSQTNIRKASNQPVMKKVNSTYVITPSESAKTESTPDDLTPTPRVRSGSYTIRKSESTDRAPDGLPSAEETTSPAQQTGSVQTRPFGEEDFRRSIGKLVWVRGQRELGVLRYFGPLHCLDGLFCGIEFDNPIGLHDGQLGDRRYFHAKFKHGTFCPMEHVHILDQDESHEESATTLDRMVQPLMDSGLLTDVEPDLWEGPLYDSTILNSSASLELNSSLTFLKGSRFPGMDVSMTPSELLEKLRVGDNDGPVALSEITPMQFEHIPNFHHTPVLSNGPKPNSSQPASKFGSDGDARVREAMAIASHNARGFDAMAVVVKHLSERVVPDLRDTLDRARSTIDELTRIESNQTNENRQLREHYEKVVQELRRERDLKIQQLRVEFQKQIAQKAATLRLKIENEYKAVISQQTKEIQKYQMEVQRLEKLANERLSEVSSLRMVYEIRSNELRESQTRCNILERERDEAVDELAKVGRDHTGKQPCGQNKQSNGTGII